MGMEALNEEHEEQRNHQVVLSSPSFDDIKDTHSEQIETVCYCNNDNRNSNDYNSYTRDNDYSLDSCNEMN